MEKWALAKGHGVLGLGLVVLYLYGLHKSFLNKNTDLTGGRKKMGTAIWKKPVLLQLELLG